MTAPNKVILVTGGNRGIGLAILKALATHVQTRKATLLMGCRDVGKSQAAIDELKAEIHDINVSPVEIDVTSDTSIRNAMSKVESDHGRLDVLINNAGFAMLTSAPDFSDVREAFSKTYDTNVTSIVMTTSLFLPLLRHSTIGGKVINISSARGSMTRSAGGQLPPTAAAAYSVSKTALNALTIEMSRQEVNKDVEFQLAAPGHCKTQFNGFRGTRDPLEGANVVVELVIGEKRKLGYWETHGASRDLVEVPW